MPTRFKGSAEATMSNTWATVGVLNFSENHSQTSGWNKDLNKFYPLFVSWKEILALLPVK